MTISVRSNADNSGDILNQGLEAIHIDAVGKVDFSVGILGFEFSGSPSAGYLKLPTWLGKLMFQFGSSVGTTDGSGQIGVSLPTAFATTNHFGTMTVGDDPGATIYIGEQNSLKTSTYFQFVVRNTANGIPEVSKTYRISWFRWGVAP